MGESRIVEQDNRANTVTFAVKDIDYTTLDGDLIVKVTGHRARELYNALGDYFDGFEVDK